jgi:hypothetical protein
MERLARDLKSASVCFVHYAGHIPVPGQLGLLFRRRRAAAGESTECDRHQGSENKGSRDEWYPAGDACALRAQAVVGLDRGGEPRRTDRAGVAVGDCGRLSNAGERVGGVVFEGHRGDVDGECSQPKRRLAEVDERPAKGQRDSLTTMCVTAFE